jgi:hypothetical protein
MKLKTLLDSRLPVNWATMRTGWNGPGKFPPQLSVADVAAYATQLIEENLEQPDCVLRLAGADENEREMVEKCLLRLAAQAGADEAVELRKWRALMLEEVLETLDDSPLYGLIGLTEFWEKFDYPPDSPHQVQGRDDQLSPADYYTAANFRRVLAQHRRWLDEEKASLKVASSRNWL